jgi:hypothetical protein
MQTNQLMTWKLLCKDLHLFPLLLSKLTSQINLNKLQAYTQDLLGNLSHTISIIFLGGSSLEKIASS